MEKKSQFIQRAADYFRNNYKGLFQHKGSKECASLIEYHLMRDYYDAINGMSKPEVEQLRKELTTIIDFLIQEIKMKGITYYTIVNKVSIEYKNIKEKIFYFQNDFGDYEVYTKNAKYVMDKETLDFFLKEMKRKDFAEYNRKFLMKTS